MDETGESNPTVKQKVKGVLHNLWTYSSEISILSFWLVWLRVVRYSLVAISIRWSLLKRKSPLLAASEPCKDKSRVRKRRERLPGLRGTSDARVHPPDERQGQDWIPQFGHGPEQQSVGPWRRSHKSRLWWACIIKLYRQRPNLQLMLKAPFQNLSVIWF